MSEQQTPVRPRQRRYDNQTIYYHYGPLPGQGINHVIIATEDNANGPGYDVAEVYTWAGVDDARVTAQRMCDLLNGSEDRML